MTVQHSLIFEHDIRCILKIEYLGRVMSSLYRALSIYSPVSDCFMPWHTHQSSIIKLNMTSLPSPQILLVPPPLALSTPVLSPALLKSSPKLFPPTSTLSHSCKTKNILAHSVALVFLHPWLVALCTATSPLRITCLVPSSNHISTSPSTTMP